MNKNLLYNLVAIRIIHFVLAILAAAAAAGFVAFIVAQFTEDVESIVISSLVGVWIAEVILYIIRCKVIINKRLKVAEEVDSLKLAKKKRNLIKRYTVFSIVFAVILGFILYNLKDSTINNILGRQNTHQTENVDDNLLIVKIAVLVVLLIVFIIRLAIRKRHKNKSI